MSCGVMRMNGTNASRWVDLRMLVLNQVLYLMWFCSKDFRYPATWTNLPWIHCTYWWSDRYWWDCKCFQLDNLTHLNRQSRYHWRYHQDFGTQGKGSTCSMYLTRMRLLQVTNIVNFIDSLQRMKRASQAQVVVSSPSSSSWSLLLLLLESSL